MVVIRSVEELEKFHKKHGIEPLTKQARKAYKESFDDGNEALFTLNEVKKDGKLQRHIIRPLVLLNYTAMGQVKWQKANLITTKPHIGWMGLWKPMYIHHWSAENQKAPWDFIWKMGDWTLALDFKKPNATRLCMQPKWGQQPKLKEKIRKAREAHMVPALIYPDYDLLQRDQEKSLSNCYIYPLTEDGYLTGLDSDPYRLKLQRLSSTIQDLLIFKSLGCWEQYKEEYEGLSQEDIEWLRKEFGYEPPNEIERKPLIIHWETWRR